jgi:hypothetical protein
MGGACSTHGGEERWVQGFGGGKLMERLFGRPRGRWEYSIKMDLLKVGWRTWT